MSEPNKVYIVTTGCYSDYGINRVFTSEQLAQEYAARCNVVGRTSDFEFSRVEEYDIETELPSITSSARLGAKAVTIYIRSATVWDNKWQQPVEDEPTGETVFVPLSDPPPKLNVNIDRRKNGAGNNVVHMEVRGPDYERVRKVYGERLAQERALLLGI